ncbi:MAG: RnfABCDGE type electron transport complex subunit D, partial [Candidatus Bathyarchaeota archaeon]
MVNTQMTKDLLMQYTFVALFFIALLSYTVFGIESLLVSLISVGVAVGCDILLSKVMVSKGPRNTMSAIVFGLIVALSYSLGEPTLMSTETFYPVIGQGLELYLYPALISAVGLIVFKKLQGLAGRKYVNPAAISKLLVLGLIFLPMLTSVNVLLPEEHATSINLQAPLTEEVFGATLITCYGDQNTALMRAMSAYSETGAFIPGVMIPESAFNMIIAKYHGWAGGFSSILVMAIGLVLFAVCRKYIKWRITFSYLITTAVVAIIMGVIYGGDGLLTDITLRLMFHLFIGSSIFLAFFMATDPATTPVTRLGQMIFGVGLAILTMVIQVYMGFLGGSILALVIMNLTSPILDNVGRLKPGKREDQEVLPGYYYAPMKVVDCMKCGACMNVCVNGLSPILIKQARAKKNSDKLMKLHAEYCVGCGNCNLVCPSGIYLESETLGYNLQEEEASEIEQQFLSGKSDENIGVNSNIFSAKSTIEGQDGGVVTSLLVSGMKKNLFDAAIVVKRTDGYLADAVVAENVDELLNAKGTKYVRVSMMSKLGDLIRQGKRKIALVGTACQIRAARRLQQILMQKYPDLQLTIIGLFCYEIFDYKMLKEETKRLLGVNLDDAEKTQISKGKYIVTIKGKDYSAKVKDLNAAVEKRCLGCPDFTAMYSDISIGSVGSPDGYSTIIVRSDIGKDLVSKLDLIKGSVDKEEIQKLSVQKKNRAV